MAEDAQPAQFSIDEHRGLTDFCRIWKDGPGARAESVPTAVGSLFHDLAAEAAEIDGRRDPRRE